ncbi:hypothetical protein HAX54_027629 [Datura stramonium]|uniref:Uncharacterized protein n=1 Tax=Datura stramonium TaxID=4076 RepID=A0ABS8V3N8_DATST|nr:hypothetical protein [Datura stramonium]
MCRDLKWCVHGGKPKEEKKESWELVGEAHCPICHSVDKGQKGWSTTSLKYYSMSQRYSSLGISNLGEPFTELMRNNRRFDLIEFNFQFSTDDEYELETSFVIARTSS